MNSFKSLNVDRDIVKALDVLGYEKPTAVQKEAIPVIMDNHDLIIKSPTGSGKTAAFAIPLCEKIVWEEQEPQALILTPTRELAVQVHQEIFNIGRFKRIKSLPVYGKVPIKHQISQLNHKMHVVVGTPGRVFDLIRQNALNLDNLKYLVLDEVDTMLDMGFKDQVDDILNFVPENRINIVLSATINEEAQAIIDAFVADAVMIDASSTMDEAPLEIEQYSLQCVEEEKYETLTQLIDCEDLASGVIFCNTKWQVDELVRQLKMDGYNCNKLHGGMRQRDRLSMMERFKRRQFRFLVATDVAGRGIDVDKLECVINYDIPEVVETYTHRIGRTARKGDQGKAYSIVGEIDEHYYKNLLDAGYAIQPITLTNERALRPKAKSQAKEIAKKDIGFADEIMKIHINAGKKQKMRPLDIVGTLCNIEGMEAKDIGVIEILDISTYVEVLNGKGTKVINALETKPLKGRLRTVSKVIR